MGFRDNPCDNCNINMKITKLLPIIGISILIYLIYRIGLFTLYETLITANLYYVLLAVFFLTISVIILTLKWWIILKIQNIHIKFLDAFKIYLIGTFYGAITPSRSGSLIRASYVKDKTDYSFAQVVPSILLERLMDLFVIFVYSLIGVLVFSRYISNFLPSIIIAFIIFLLFALFLLKKNLNKLFLKFIYKFLIPEKLKDKSKELYHTFYSSIPSFKKLIFPLIFTFITWIILSIHPYFIVRAYSVNINLFYLILIFAIATIVSLIPVTVGGLGTREATLIFLFSFFDVPAAKVVSISFLILLLGNMLLPLVGFLFSLKEPQPDKLL